ncbi:hypothetical protein BDR07DRAFT_1408245 [Suillus spraguei]|nr:hypothetical protein BDR07DRAFT_1408245 [Suillus spraguei]
MAPTFFVSSQSTHHTTVSCKFLVVSSSCTAIVPAACTHSLASTQPLKHSVHLHRYDQRDPVLPEVNQFLALHTIYPHCVRTRNHDTHAHTRHTELMDELEPSVRCFGEIMDAVFCSQ